MGGIGIAVYVIRSGIVLIDEMYVEVNDMMEIWKETLEYKVFSLTWTKTEYQECKFRGGGRSEDQRRFILGL